ncbi:orotidine-5'-phosphate decarboxylase [Paenibacillus chartarius]|uniref:Orotidine 5'-phosphate decarboxylase n=1 Tax=Paenibacillus chartarius TaxID=747481 RepID=A0ABV6DNG6_9BACL
MAEKNEIASRIMVALDYPDAAAAETLVASLQGIPCYMKVGMQLFYAAGPRFVTGLKERGYRVFLDVKMHDIPNTVKGGSESVARLGVDMFNVHAAGGRAMMEAALEGVDKAVSGGVGMRPLVIAVTQLTSTSQAMLNEEIGIAGSVEDAVLRYARLAQTAGLDGVVVSALEVPALRRELGDSFVTVTPGIRPAGADIGDQSRVLTPAEALRMGSSYIVIGRPITAAGDPRAALESIIESIQ